MDTVYVKSYVVNKKLSRKGGKMFAFFVNFKAAFDNVNRQQLNDEEDKDKKI